MYRNLANDSQPTGVRPPDRNISGDHPRGFEPVLPGAKDLKPAANGAAKEYEQNHNTIEPAPLGIEPNMICIET